MREGRLILAINGSYRRTGAVAKLVEAAAAAAEGAGARVHRIDLVDQDIAFCRNCRACTQEPGAAPGRCVLEDDMWGIIERIEAAEGLIIGAPVNFFNINALTRRFMERLVCYADWPWGRAAPKYRKSKRTKRAVLISTSAAPAFIGRWVYGATGALKLLARTVGARPIGKVWAGLVCVEADARVGRRALAQAERLGRKLAR